MFMGIADQTPGHHATAASSVPVLANSAPGAGLTSYPAPAPITEKSKSNHENHRAKYPLPLAVTGLVVILPTFKIDHSKFRWTFLSHFDP
jgi:hypothetical protein